MPDWSLRGLGGRQEEGGSDLSDSGATLVTTSGTANTKGSYAELIASTSFDAFYMLLTLATDDTDPFLTDVAVGAGGSEQIILADFLTTVRGGVASHIFIPLFIPAGSRIAARAQAIAVSQKEDVQVRLFGNTFAGASPMGRSTTYGAATGDSGGVQIDPGATINTKGAYSEIVASTTNPTRALFFSLGTQDNFSRGNHKFILDIAVGAATSEQDIIDNFSFRVNTQADSMFPPNAGPFPVNIPAGTRISARAQSNINDASDRLFDLVVYGMD